MKNIKVITILSMTTIAIIAGFFYWKKSSSIIPTSKPKITLCDIKVDSFRVYRADSIQKGAMMFSPLERNKIWIINSNNKSAELDLNTYHWASIPQKYGDWFKNINGNVKVITDNYENIVWLHPNFLNHGIWKYNKDTKQYKTIAGHIHNVVPDKDAIWLTYDNFIMRLDRKTEIIDTLKDIPTGYISTLSISDSRENELIVNNTHKFSYRTKSYELIQDGNIADCNRPSNFHCSFNMPSQVQTDYISGIATCDKENIWCLKKDEMYSQKISNQMDLLGYFWAYDQQPRQALSDDENLYVLYERDFVIINKDFLQKKSYSFGPILQKIEFCQKLRDSLRIYEETNLDSLMFKINIYVQAAKGIDERLIKEDIDRFKSRYSSNVSKNDALKLIERNDVDTTIQDAIYKRLIAEEALNGNFKTAINFWDKHQAKLPDIHIYPYYRASCELLRITQFKLDSIEQEVLPEDDMLWQKGNIIKNLCYSTTWFEGNVFYNTELADRMHQKLIKLYPQSLHADDIVYDSIMLAHHPGCGEYEYSDDFEKDLKTFCHSYPDSEFWAEAMNFRGWLYNTASEEYHGVKKQYEKSKAIYQVVLDRFPDNKEAREGVLLNQAIIDVEDLQLKITSNRNKISPNGKVSVTFVLKNPTNRTITIPLFSDKYIPNFELRAMQHQRNSCTYDPNIDAPSIAIDKKVDWQRTKQYDLLPKESYTETIELTEKVPLHNFRFIKYQFSQKDKYTISASFRFPYHNTGNRELLVTSNQLSLIVE